MSVVCLEQGDWVDYSQGDLRQAGVRADRLARLALCADASATIPATIRSRSRIPTSSRSTGTASAAPRSPGRPTGCAICPATSGCARSTASPTTGRSPIEDLMPHYDRTEREFAVSGVAGDPMYPGQDELLPPVDLTKAGPHRRRRPQPARLALVARHQRHRHRAAQRAGTLPAAHRLHVGLRREGQGLDRPHPLAGADQGGRALWSPTPASRGSRLDGSGLARGAVYVDRTTGQGAAAPRPRSTVIAANGIGTPRLLLSSRAPGQEHGRRQLLGPGRQAADAASDGRGRRPVRRAAGKLSRRLGAGRLHAAILRDRQGSRLRARLEMEPAADRQPGADRPALAWGDENQLWGAPFHDEFARRFGRSVSWGIICEDLPDVENRVELDDATPDDSGMPGVTIHYKTGENSKRMLHFMAERAKESLMEAGAYRTVVAPQSRESGWHILGTAKMGDDPATAWSTGMVARMTCPISSSSTAASGRPRPASIRRRRSQPSPPGARRMSSPAGPSKGWHHDRRTV